MSKKDKKQKYIELDFDGPSLSDINDVIVAETEEGLDDVQYFVENIEDAIDNVETAIDEGDMDKARNIIAVLREAIEEFLACDECELEADMDDKH